MQRLAEIETVTINLPGGRDFDCAVIAVAGSTAALKPFGFTTAKLMSRIDGVLISFVYERRLIGLKGSLSREGDTLRFSVEDGMHSNGRRSTRVPVELPIRLHHVGRDERASGTTINIATEGVLVRSGLEVATGDALELELALPRASAILATTGRVVRHADDLLAVEFGRDAHAVTAEFVIAEKLRAQPV